MQWTGRVRLGRTLKFQRSQSGVALADSVAAALQAAVATIEPPARFWSVLVLQRFGEIRGVEA
jgi:hypothetical protein